ncbi:glycerol-3-phosphate ABC transporter ATP-binding protein [Lampropedia cohaerens]|uniref:Glycerol-3-phosphate ABC transporter ATP-binding protein n=1 Tax=Lampropedia cohaerens TaxID=1610491 RepID=A0A0U1PYM9_9BURK|nr:ABC transporter ATP-binding protein [Lampropedia cohaerens]KKW67622.1 glycerol-3-phosphate ABC transporter ATP-binding protein [Lampropedia cohaerens]
MTAQSLHITGVGKRFGPVDVLTNIDLQVRAGEFLSLVGMSGCGKSTLLRIIAGLESPDRGSITIGERDVTQVDPAERNLAMVFQSYALYPHMTVRQNIATPLRMRQLSAWARLPWLGALQPGRKAILRDIDARVQQAAELLEIGQLLERKPAQLSGGQRQRVALARALVRAPAAFLMDEPLSNLDARLRAHMRGELTALHKRLGATFIYVTHDQVEAMTMSDRVALMEGGRILQLGTPTQLYDTPASLAVARFIGTPTINTLPVQVDAQGHVHAWQQPLPLHAPGVAAGPATLGIRPEDLHLASEGLAARVVRLETHGADRFVTLALLHDAALQLTLRQRTGEAAPAAGSTVHIACNWARVHLFDAEAARRTCVPALHLATATDAQRPREMAA